VQDERDFADAFDAAHAKLTAAVDSACRGGGSWPTKVVAAVAAVLEFAAGEPGEAKVLTTSAFDYGAYGTVRHRQMIDRLATQLAAGRQCRQAPKDLPELIEEALLGGIAEIVAERLRSGREETLPELSAELSELILTPYVGAAEARRIAAGELST
jgi:hypothetical protein